jgi:hypothetical protein
LQINALDFLVAVLSPIPFQHKDFLHLAAKEKQIVCSQNFAVLCWLLSTFSKRVATLQSPFYIEFFLKSIF